MRREQRFETLAQSGVAVTRAVQKVGALFDRLFQGHRKQGFFAGWIVHEISCSTRRGWQNGGGWGIFCS